MDKVVKLAIIIGAFLAGVGVFYHYVIFLPEAQREESSAADRQKREIELRELQRRNAYGACLGEARRNYEAQWAASCKEVAVTRAGELKSCLSNKSVVTNPYMGADFCKRSYGDADPSPQCSLPQSRAQFINDTYKQEQDRCATEARLGLQ